jgi:hypothetical protein
MTVVHFAKLSALYPRVVISSLGKRLEKPPFCHSYTSIGVWSRDHHMSLQRLTMGRMPSFAKVVCSTMAPIAPCEPGRVTTPNPHLSEQGTLSITSLIIKQSIPYWTHGDTCCPGVSTPMTQSLADSSMRNHKL